MKLKLLLLVLALVLKAYVATEFSTTAPFVGQLYVPEIPSPRGMVLDSEGDVLVASANSRISAIRETNHGNGTSTVGVITIIDGDGLALNHGIAIQNGYLYASSPTIVYRWPYRPGQFSLINNNTIETVINDIPGGGNHITRTLIFDAAGTLYISIGSRDNVDQDSSRSRIRRFNLELQSLPISFNNGELFADGCRNTVGLGLSGSGILYGVDNGADLLNRPDLGGEIWADNPAEEMNKFNLPAGRHYGYPYCWSTYKLLDLAPGTQYTWPNFLNDGSYTDSYCQNLNNNVPPILSMPPHSAPLGIEFYNGVSCGVNGGFPCAAMNDAFVAFRGSWHANVTNGYRVSWYPFTRDTEVPTGEVTDIIYAPNPTNSCNECLRPVNAIFNKNGHLIVSVDTTGEIFRVAYNTVLPEIIFHNHDDDEHNVSSRIHFSLYSSLLFMYVVYFLLY